MIGMVPGTEVGLKDASGTGTVGKFSIDGCCGMVLLGGGPTTGVVGTAV